MNTNIFDIIKRGVPVAGDVGLGYIVVWNGQQTLNLWLDQYYADGPDGTFKEVDVRILSDVPADIWEAREKANDWLADIFNEAEELTR